MLDLGYTSTSKICYIGTIEARATKPAKARGLSSRVVPFLSQATQRAFVEMAGALFCGVPCMGNN